MIRRALVLAVGLAPVLAPFAACGGDNGAADADAAQQADTARSDRIAIVDSDSGVTDAQPDRAPTYNTDGWIGVPFEPDYDCGFYAAPTLEKMPPPIQWEPCDPALAAGTTCRQMTTNWAPPANPNDTSAIGLAGYVAATGHAWIVLRRFSGPSIFQLVAEADGPIHQAIVSPRTNCYLNTASLFGGNVIFSASHQNAGTIYRWGAVGGAVDKVPVVLESHGDGVSRGYAAGPNAYFTYPEYTLRTWTSPSSLVANVATPSSGTAEYYSFVGDAMFFPFGNLAYHRISLYTPDGGTQDFVSYGNDVAKGASDFGTDGKDMVWTEAFGREAPGKPWTTIDIMTAPFTTDPSAIQKRRLRSEANSIGASPFTVGCGYAAHDFSSLTEGTGTRLVRLSDGRSWRFTENAADGGFPWQFNGPLAITCDELFVRFHRGYQFNVARIRLDSLGPGDPPD